WYAVTYRYDWTLQGETIRILCFAAALGIGVAVSRRKNWAGIVGGTLGASLLFYLVTNTASWAGDMAYSHDFAGWVQAMTVGHPQFASTISFYKNTLASDLSFVAVFALGMEYQARRRGQPSLLGLKQVGG
ncbi:MAG TPA: DUF6580 family putative transport protein, partial [Elusimicrobiota bacterium]|nr:DUF6580 family putative transport protein [Elusimicrobiota bacterium]